MDNYSLGTSTLGIHVKFLILTIAAGNPQGPQYTHEDKHVNMYIRAWGPALHVHCTNANCEHQVRFLHGELCVQFESKMSNGEARCLGDFSFSLGSN